jgi:eukaryotic-like serine/threonine-protein kinase
MRLGPYEIQAAVGSGGMGEVYRARDTRLDRTVAIKVLSPQFAEDPAFRARFESEARAISQLSHPHICTLHDIGTSDDPSKPGSHPVSYLVMELVEGETLSDRLERGPLPPDQAVAFASQIADALDRAHRTGIVHGDLKPGNIMLTKGGVKLLDFGLATRRQPDKSQATADVATQTVAVSSAGRVFGTLQYLSPEQLEGRAPDERSDIFALGAVLYEMVTGRKAFDGQSPATVIASIVRDAPQPMVRFQPSTPPALEHVVMTCLAKDPDERWQHAGDLARELSWIAEGDAAVPARTGGGRQVGVWTAAIAAGLLAAIVGAVFAYLAGRVPDLPVYRTSILLPEGLTFPVAGAIGGVGRLSLSPDGRRLAFVATDANGNQLLWVRPLDAVAAAPVPGTDGALSPFWSPDSRFVAFIAQGQLRRVDPIGGRPVTLATAFHPTTGAWSRDGTILFTPTASSPLHAIPASGGTPRPVTTLNEQAGDVVHRSPFFLPDGEHFLYVAVASRPGETTAARGVYVGRLDSPDSSRVVIDEASHAMYAQGHLLYLRDNVLVAQPFDTSRLALTGVPTPLTEQVELIGAWSAAFAVSETGVLAYQPAAGGSQLVWFDREGRQLDALGEPASYGDVELSPDGQRAAVSVLDRTTNTRDLWVFDVVRGVRTRFTSHPAEDISPIWSPDGREIIFASNRGGNFDLYRKSASGVGVEELVFGSQSEKYPTSWAPDGRSILYWTFDLETAGLWQLLLEGEDASRSRRILPSPVSQGRLSPDGRWISYYSPESGRWEVYVVPFPRASGKWQVSSVGGTFSRWRSDGREIFYAGRDNRLMAVTVDGDGEELEVGPARPLFEARPVGRGLFFDVSPDGRFLVNSQRGEHLASSIVLLQNWRATLARDD